MPVSGGLAAQAPEHRGRVPGRTGHLRREIKALGYTGRSHPLVRHIDRGRVQASRPAVSLRGLARYRLAADGLRGARYRIGTGRTGYDFPGLCWPGAGWGWLRLPRGSRQHAGHLQQLAPPVGDVDQAVAAVQGDAADRAEGAGYHALQALGLVFSHRDLAQVVAV